MQATAKDLDLRYKLTQYQELDKYIYFSKGNL